VAHAEGRFIMSERLLRELKEMNLTVFRYADANGNISPEFPINPNGSMDNLAAVCNPAGNVMAMMPHPERSQSGDVIFSSMRDYIYNDTKMELNTLDFVPERFTIYDYHSSNSTFEFLVDLIITDNEAVSVESALQHMGLPVKITRQTHWEVKAATDEEQKLKKDIIASGELFNSNKEKLVSYKKQDDSISFLVRYQDDVIGQHKLGALKHWFNIDGIQSLKKGILWTITVEEGDVDKVVKDVLDTHILFNRYSHICYQYS
jgi:phosphoribosylformylglycinamidine synthase